MDDDESLPAGGSESSLQEEGIALQPLSMFESLQRRAMLAQMLGVPAHVLGSSLRQQTAARLVHSRRKSDRLALYRPALRANATSILTAKRDTNRGQDWTEGKQKPVAGSTERSALAAGITNGDDHARYSGDSKHTASSKSNPSEAPMSRSAGSSPALADSALAGRAVETPPHPPSAATQWPLLPGSLPKGADPVFQAAAWRQLSSAAAAAISVLVKARAHSGQAGEGGGGAGTGGAFRARLRQNMTDELHRELDGAVEELREAVAQLPAHRVAWYLGSATAVADSSGVSAAAETSEAEGGNSGRVATGGRRAVDGGASAASGDEARKGGALSWLLGGVGQLNQQRDPGSEVLAASQLPRRALELLQAHVLLSRPNLLGRCRLGSGSGAAPGPGGTGSPSGSGSCLGADQVEIASHDSQRAHHRRAALVIMDALLPNCGLSTLPYPELAALAAAQAALGQIPAEQEPQAGGGRGAKPPLDLLSATPNCVIDTQFLLRLVRRCAAELAAATHPSARGRAARRPNAGHPRDTKLMVTDGPNGVMEEPRAGHPGLERQQQEQRHSQKVQKAEAGSCQALELLEEGAVWLLEEVAVRATRAHVAAMMAAVERCGAKSGEAGRKGGGPKAVAFRDVYTEALRPGSTGAGRQPQGPKAKKGAAAAAAAAAAAPPRSDPRDAEPLLDEVLQKVLAVLPQLVDWEGTSATAAAAAGAEVAASGDDDKSRGAATAAAGGPTGELGGGEHCLVLGKEFGKAFAIYQTGAGSDSDNSRAGGAGSPPSTAGSGTAAGGSAADAVTSSPGAIKLERLAMAQAVLQAALDGRPQRLMVLGADSLRSLLAAVSAVGNLRQTSLPHPAALASHGRGPHPTAAAAGPLLLLFEMAAGNRRQPRWGGGGRDRAEGSGGAPLQLPELSLGRLAVTVVPRSVAEGQVIRRLRMFAQDARRRGNRTGPVIEVPPDGFSCLSQGRGRGQGGASLAEYEHRLREVLGSHGCAWLQCTNMEALQAGALLVAQVHHGMLQNSTDPTAAGAHGTAASRTFGRQASVPPPLPPGGGLEVLPMAGHWRCEQRVRDAAGRIFQDLLQARQAARQQASPTDAELGTEQRPGSQLGRTNGRWDGGPRPAASGGQGLLEEGWEAIRRLSVNREASALLGVLADWSVPPGELALSVGGASGTGSAATEKTAGTSALWQGSDARAEGMGLLVFKRTGLEHGA